MSTPPLDESAAAAAAAGDLTGRLAVVTGAAHGIGSAIGNALAAAGADVRRVDRVAGPGLETLDVTDAAAVDAFFAALPRCDVLVNCAGGVVGQVHVPIEEVREADWRAVVDANLTGTFLCTRAAAPLLKTSGHGRIVTISSGAGRSVSLTGIQAYASAKAAQIAFTRQLAHELGPHAVTVNCVAPGFVLSNPTTVAQWESYGQAGQTALVQGIALRRLGRASDIAAGVAFFVSDAASWVTGQTLSIDGGHALF